MHPISNTILIIASCAVQGLTLKVVHPVTHIVEPIDPKTYVDIIAFVFVGLSVPFPRLPAATRIETGSTVHECRQGPDVAWPGNP